MSCVTISAEVFNSLLGLASPYRVSSHSSGTQQSQSSSSANSIISEAPSYDENLGGPPILQGDITSRPCPLIDGLQFRWDALFQTPLGPLPQSQLTDDLYLTPNYGPLYDTVVQQGAALNQTPNQSPTRALAAAKREDRQIRRRMQNRQSQRAFRDRKEKRLKSLEEAVASMANIRNALEAENVRLKVQLEVMKEEGGELVKRLGTRPLHVEDVKSIA